jgi:phospholipid/cholesterol/gamma-HCH transport system substrate-binding protein
MTAGAKTSRLIWQIVITAVVMLALVGYVAKLRGTFDDKHTLQLQTASGADLFEGMQISYKGFTLGRITKLRLTPEGQVQGRVEIQADKANFFTQGSVLKISKEKIVTTELVLVRDAQQTTPLANQAAIAVVRDDLAADVTRRLEPLLEHFQQLLQQMSDPQHGIQAVMKQSRSVMVQTNQTLDQTTRTMTLMNDTEKGLPAVLDQTRMTMGALQPTAQQATKTLVELEKSIAQTRETMASTQTLLQHIDTTVSEVESAPIYRWLVPAKNKPAN